MQSPMVIPSMILLNTFFPILTIILTTTLTGLTLSKTTQHFWTLKDDNMFPPTLTSADLNLRRQILKLKHDALSTGHPGVLETLLAVSKDYYWPGLRTFVRNYVAGCLECQRFKINRHPARS